MLIREKAAWIHVWDHTQNLQFPWNAFPLFEANGSKPLNHTLLIMLHFVFPCERFCAFDEYPQKS